MYHASTDTPCVTRTSNLNSDLGQITHVFSDKTGTLTRNVMRFVACSAGGVVFGSKGRDNAGRGQSGAVEEVEREDALDPAFEESLKASDQAPALGVHAQDLRKLLLAMAVCQTVVTEEGNDPDGGDTIFTSESPDEKALTEGARSVMVMGRGRERTKVYNGGVAFKCVTTLR